MRKLRGKMRENAEVMRKLCGHFADGDECHNPPPQTRPYCNDPKGLRVGNTREMLAEQVDW